MGAAVGFTFSHGVHATVEHSTPLECGNSVAIKSAIDVIYRVNFL